jgi:hypothetical protein
METGRACRRGPPRKERVLRPSFNRAARRRQDQQKQPRFSAEAWDRIRDQISREHRVLAASDPRSPRIKPSLWSVR